MVCHTVVFQIRRRVEKLRWLQNAWREGIDSGDAGEIDFAELKAEARRRLAAKS
jgi:antitoxin ParD1/3/4